VPYRGDNNLRFRGWSTPMELPQTNRMQNIMPIILCEKIDIAYNSVAAADSEYVYIGNDLLYFSRHSLFRYNILTMPT